VQVYELGREGTHYYIAMELVDGLDLRELQNLCRVERRRWPLQLVLWVGHEVAQALVYAHGLQDADGRSLELIHRDISPQNILISYDGQVKVTDFGIAKATNSQHETVTGAFKGKFAYMSPEQASQRAIDQRSDLFSIGIVLYELATGERLFAADRDIEILDRVRAATLPDSAAFRQLRPAMQDLLRHLLAKEVAVRPADAAQLAAEIKAVMHQLDVGADRSALAAFVQEIAAKGLTQRKKAREERAQWLEPFLEEEETPVLGQVETKTRQSQSDKRSDGTAVLVHAPILRRPVSPFMKQWREYRFRLGGGLVVVCFCIGIAWWLWPRGPQSLETAVAEARLVRSAEDSLPGGESQAVELSKTSETVEAIRNEAPKTGRNGRLSVQAVPWGYVYLDGQKKRRETPLRGLKLAAGTHQVKVVYQATGEVVERTVDIKGGKGVTCIARFGKNKGISCQ